MLTLHDIRLRYPHPMAVQDRWTLTPTDTCQYCVGGALALDPGHFCLPDDLELARLIGDVNPQLSTVRAQELADLIIRDNDASDFDQAWGWVECVLTEGGIQER